MADTTSCAECGSALTQPSRGGLRLVCSPNCARLRGNRQQVERAAAKGRRRRVLRIVEDDGNTRCPRCNQVKSNTEFSVSRTRIDGLNYDCKQCVRNRRSGKRSPEALRAARRKNQLQKYNLTLADYDRMSRNQGDVCAICGDTVRLLHVDHDHDTGAVRGLLCQPCNLGLGNFKDRPNVVAAAAQYLLNHNASEAAT